MKLIHEGDGIHHLYVKNADVWLNDDELIALKELLTERLEPEQKILADSAKTCKDDDQPIKKSVFKNALFTMVDRHNIVVRRVNSLQDRIERLEKLMNIKWTEL